ncbi:glucose-6-phosphate isomerase [Desulfovulcanus sp.]
MADYIHWTTAYQGRVQKVSPDAESRLASEISGRLKSELADDKLPFLSLNHWPGLKENLASLKDRIKKYDHLLLLGIGGSALGTKALQKAFFSVQDQPGHKGPWLWIGDNICTSSLESWVKNLPPEKTLVVVISKSGGTIETISQYFLVKKWLKENMPNSWSDHILVITDAHQGFLREEVARHNLISLDVPKNLGGRYSVLSAVGLAPALFMGLDIDELVAGAQAMAAPLVESEITPQILSRYPGWKLALWAKTLMDTGYNQLIFFVYLPLWAHFGQWFAQLWAESLGKEGRGSMPLSAIGVTDQHSTLQMFLDGPKDKGCIFLTCSGLKKGPVFDSVPSGWEYLKGKSFGEILEAEALGTKMALALGGVPLVGLDLEKDSLFSAGKLIMLLEVMTLLTGWLMDINPLNQPAVELGKRLAKARLGARGFTKEADMLDSFLKQNKELERF